MTFHITEDEQQRERRMLKEIKSEPYLKMASNIRKRRERIPKIDMDSNPFCASRQLRDEYMLQNFNRVRSLMNGHILTNCRILDFTIRNCCLPHVLKRTFTTIAQ